MYQTSQNMKCQFMINVYSDIKFDGITSILMEEENIINSKLIVFEMNFFNYTNTICNICYIHYFKFENPNTKYIFALHH